MNLVIRLDAAADLEEAFMWYERQRLGLGDEFLHAVQRTLEALLETPHRFGVVHRIRDALWSIGFPTASSTELPATMSRSSPASTAADTLAAG